MCRNPWNRTQNIVGMCICFLSTFQSVHASKEVKKHQQKKGVWVLFLKCAPGSSPQRAELGEGTGIRNYFRRGFSQKLRLGNHCP